MVGDLAFALDEFRVIRHLEASSDCRIISPAENQPALDYQPDNALATIRTLSVSRVRSCWAGPEVDWRRV